MICDHCAIGRIAPVLRRLLRGPGTSTHPSKQGRRFRVRYQDAGG